jgi:hypothetical protein
MTGVFSPPRSPTAFSVVISIAIALEVPVHMVVGPVPSTGNETRVVRSGFAFPASYSHDAAATETVERPVTEPGRSVSGSPTQFHTFRPRCVY